MSRASQSPVAIRPRPPVGSVHLPAERLRGLRAVRAMRALALVLGWMRTPSTRLGA